MKQKKTAHLQKDFKRRVLVQHYEHKRLILKTIQGNLHLTPLKRLSAFIEVSKYKNNSSKVRVRNRCVLTGRSRGVHKFFKVSRIMIRELAAKGLLPGLKKAS